MSPALIFCGVFFLSLVVGVYFFMGFAHFRELHLARLAEGNRPESHAVTEKRAVKLAIICLLVMSATLLVPDPTEIPHQIEVLQTNTEAPEMSARALIQIPDASWVATKSTELRTITSDFRSTYIRAHIPPNPRAETLVAEIAHFIIEEIDFLLVQGSQEIRRAEVGLGRPYQIEHQRGLYHSFDIPTDTTQERTLYVKIRSRGSAFFPLHIWPLEYFMRLSAAKVAVQAIFFGALIAFIFYNLYLFIFVRQNIYISFVIYQASVVVCLMILTGTLGLMWPELRSSTPGFYHYILLSCILLSTLMLAIFCAQFLALSANFIWGYRAIVFTIGTVATLGIAMPFIPQVLATILTLGHVTAGTIMMTVCCISILRYNHVFYLFVSFFGLGLSVLTQLVILFGNLPFRYARDNMIAVGALWDAFFLSLAIGEHVRNKRKKNDLLQKAVQGEVPFNTLNQVIGRSFAQNYVPREWSVAILFLDVPDFARLTERMPIHDLYHSLSQTSRIMTDIIKEHGGAIDRSLGAGLLCYFGQLTGVGKHQFINDAFKTAILIQKALSNHILNAVHGSIPALPVRIGLHADNVLVANLSGDERPDFTMIGSGVNLASRLNAACSPFKIILSESFKLALPTDSRAHATLQEIFVPIKHHTELLKAYEINPFEGAERDLEISEKLFVNMLGYSRVESRYEIIGSPLVKLDSAYGDLVLKDFSFHGLRFKANTIFSRKVLLPLKLVPKEPNKIPADIEKTMLNHVIVDICWCRKGNGNNEHGARFVGLNDSQKNLIFSWLTAVHQTAVQKIADDNQASDLGERILSISS
jgi:class 3 adenylate cyclase